MALLGNLPTKIGISLLGKVRGWPGMPLHGSYMEDDTWREFDIEPSTMCYEGGV